MKTLFLWLLVVTGDVALAQVDEEPEAVYYEVRLDELEFDKGQELSQVTARLHVDMLPYAFLEGPGTVFVHAARAESPGLAAPEWFDLAGATLVARTESRRELRGALVLPTPSPDGERILRFRVPVPRERATAGEDAFRAAERAYYRAQLDSGRTGAAWFRHQLGSYSEGPATPDRRWDSSSRDADLLATYSLFSGGRAVAENLQLDRILPPAAEGSEEVALDSIQGILVREYDWTAQLAEGDVETDPLAALVPADQYGLFFPSFAAFVGVIDQTSAYGALLAAGFEQRSLESNTRARLERQLALKLDGLTRALGPLAIESIAVTGSDPYLRTGSDVALCFEGRDTEALLAFLHARLRSVAESEQLHLERGQVRDTSYTAVISLNRHVSAIVARLGDFVVATNSLHQLERLLNTQSGADALVSSPEYRFFRQRYSRSDATESALLVVPDRAIRRWCGPRWRIGASRRTRAAAALAELHAEHLDELVSGTVGNAPRAPASAPSWLGDVRLTPEGAHSSVYGSLAFQTPIAELALASVSAEEARLYGLWRDGYQRNWTNYFDPIALRLAVSQGELGLDLTVMPLIARTEYLDLMGFAGEEQLSQGDGDPHAETVLHFALALDLESEPLQDFRQGFGGMLSMLGADPLGWIGGSLAVYLDRGGIWDTLSASEGFVQAANDLEDRINDIPLAITFEVSSPLKLAAFLVSLRAFVDGAAPGLLEWHNRDQDGRRYVEITSASGFDLSIFYASTSEAWTISTHEPTLLAALERGALRKTGELDGASAKWLGESVALELDETGIQLAEIVFGSEVRWQLQAASWNNLPILNEWKRLYPERDPLELHARVWGAELRCPGGGEYVWNAELHTMESSVFGHPGAPRPGVRLPPEWSSLVRFSSGLTFEEDGLRARVVLAR